MTLAPTALTVLAIVGGVALIAVLGWLAWLHEKKRRDALAAVAARLGLGFDPSHDRSHDEQYAHFEIFRRGHSRSAHNTLSGDLDLLGQRCPVKLGDFIYKITTRSGKSTQTHTYRFSYLIAHLPWPAAPNLLIRKEGVFDKLAGAFGFDDIDFESAQFSRRFHVKSPDKKFAYDVIDPRMMEFLLEHDPACVDIEFGRLCLSDGQRRWEPEQFEKAVHWTRAFLERWPRHVVASLAQGVR